MVTELLTISIAEGNAVKCAFIKQNYPVLLAVVLQYNNVYKKQAFVLHNVQNLRHTFKMAVLVMPLISNFKGKHLQRS